jgi:carbonic anhydrase
VSFGTAVNCMDGRVQLPVNEYLRDRYGIEYVDTITEAGPVRILSNPIDPTVGSIIGRVELSVAEHGSKLVAVAAHAECAGNTVAEEEQRRQITESVRHIAERFPAVTVVGLWVGDDWGVEHVCAIEPAGA